MYSIRTGINKLFRPPTVSLRYFGSANIVSEGIDSLLINAKNPNYIRDSVHAISSSGIINPQTNMKNPYVKNMAHLKKALKSIEYSYRLSHIPSITLLSFTSLSYSLSLLEPFLIGGCFSIMATVPFAFRFYRRHVILKNIEILKDYPDIDSNRISDLEEQNILTNIEYFNNQPKEYLMGLNRLVNIRALDIGLHYTKLYNLHLERKRCKIIAELNRSEAYDDFDFNK